ncbi:MAG: rapid alkalinization factor family protein [Fibrobacteria bacterium]
MNISKLITSFSLALAIVGGAMTLTPTSAVAAGNGSFISFDALNKNKVPCRNKANCSPGKKANPHTRGCSKQSRCARS